MSGYRDEIPFFDYLNQTGDGSYRTYRSSCSSMIGLLGTAAVVLTFAAPFWTAFQIGTGNWSRQGCLVRGYSLAATVLSLGIVSGLLLLGSTHMLEVLLSNQRMPLSSWAAIGLIFDFVFLTALGLCFIVGYSRRGRMLRR